MDDTLSRMYADIAWYWDQIDELDEYEHYQQIENLYDIMQRIQEEIDCYIATGMVSPYSGY